MRRIYIDVDGVLANLELRLINTYGAEYKEMSANKLWTTIRDNEKYFFYTLPAFAGAKKFVHTILEKYSKNNYVSILTALPFPTGYLITADADKRAWIRDFIHPAIPVHTIIGGVNKSEYINKKGDILIDDTEKVLYNWRIKGGTAIHHTSFEETLKTLETLL